MTSGKARKGEIKGRRRHKAKALDPKARGPGLPDPPPGAVLADLSQLEHDNTYSARPLFYLDRPFTCIDCGVEEVWTAADQKWWYEVAKGKLDSRAVRCLACRRSHQVKAKAARATHVTGLVAKYGIEEAALRLNRSADEVRDMLEPGRKRRRGRPPSRR